MVVDNEHGPSSGGHSAPLPHSSHVGERTPYHTDARPLTAIEQQSSATWDSAACDFPRDGCAPQLVTAQATATPDAVALVSGDQVLTYQELNRRANQLAHYLRGMGVRPNVLVAVCIERSLDMVVGMLGILKAGGAYVPMDLAYPPERIAFVLQDAQVSVLLTHQRLAATLPSHDCRVLSLDADVALLAQMPDTDLAPVATAEDLAYVIYTSGSTGQPKGVQITHESLLNLVFWHQRAFAVTPADRATQLASPAFDAAVWELWPYLTVGATVCLPDEDTRTTPAALRDWLVEQGITITFVPTTLAERLIALPWPPRIPLRFLLTGADTLYHYPPPDLPFALINNYGPTESTVVATSGPVLPNDHADGLPSIGRPIANTEIYILDERLRQVANGEPGELYIGGAGLALGYRNRPELTAARFIPHPFSHVPGARLYRTGDLARYLPNGEIAFLGRTDDQVKIRGYRVEPEEIVVALNGHPAVRASAVVARDDASGDKRLIAYVDPAPGAQLTVSSLRDHLGAHMPDYMIPAAFVSVEALPLTPNGKVDRAALPAPDASNTVRDAPSTAPSTPIEARLAEILASTLGLQQVGMDDNFFLLGGHSLLGTQLIARIADTFGVELSLHTLFESPTVAELSQEVERLILARLNTMSDDEIERLLA